MEYVLGIDVGTSACKATLLDRDGRSICAESKSYGIQAEHDGWAEQDPTTWWGAAIEAVRGVVAAAGSNAGQVIAVGVTGQMHSAVLLDGSGRVLRPAILWCDRRSAPEAATAQRDFPAFVETTGNPPLPAFTLTKLLWIRHHEPDVYRRVRAVLVPKDHLRLRLTGESATEPSDASGTAMFDVRSRTWSGPIIEQFGIPPEWLPHCIESSEVAGVLTGEAAEALGLRAGTPVVAGAGDQAAQALAIGAIGPGVLGVQIGTSGVIVCGSDRSVAGAFCHALPGRWLRLDSMHSAGLCLAWYRGTFASERSFEELAEIAGAVTPGSDGLLFLPFLLGERASFASSVPAAFFGIRPGHAAPQFVRSILEGVAFELRRMLEAWVANGAVPTEARLVGGGAKDPVWASILANVLAIPVTQVARDSAFGAAVLAGISAQWWDEVPLAGDGLVVEPSATAADEYHAAYRRYAALHALLRSLAAE